MISAVRAPGRRPVLLRLTPQVAGLCLLAALAWVGAVRQAVRMGNGPGGSTVLRVYEASGTPANNVRIRLHAKILSAHEANLMEDSGRRLKTVNDAVQVDLHPFEIKTLKLRLKVLPLGG